MQRRQQQIVVYGAEKTQGIQVTFVLVCGVPVNNNNSAPASQMQYEYVSHVSRARSNMFISSKKMLLIWRQ